MSSYLSIHGKEYNTIICIGDKISGEPFLIAEQNHIQNEYYLQMLRDIGFNGYCNINDILEFDIIALERDTVSIQTRIHNLINDRNSGKDTNAITWCHVKYILKNNETYQDIYDVVGNIIGKIHIQLYECSPNTYMYMLPNVVMTIPLPCS
jgi:hypothetical protein